MRLRAHDRIQIDGLPPYNPVTGARIEGMLQYFVLTRDVDGDMLPIDALLPRPGFGYPGVEEPIAMDRVR